MGALLSRVGIFLRSAWQDMRALVQITEVKSAEVLLLSARQESDVRNVLRLSLLNARITLLSRQTELLEADLTRSSQMIDTYFDSQAPLVQQAKEVLDGIHQAQLDLVLPEMKASTSALRLAQASQPVQGNKP
jgi:uroporphyrin-3 C-methyltransferase